MTRLASLGLFLAVANLASAQSTGLTVSAARTYGPGNDPNHSYPTTTNSDSASLSDSFVSPRSSYSFSLGYTSLTANVTATYVDSNHYGNGFVNISSVDPVTVVPANGVTGGQLKITYHVHALVTPGLPTAFYPTATVSFPDATGAAFNGQGGNSSADYDYVATVNVSANTATNLTTGVVANTLIDTVGASGATAGSASITVTRSNMVFWANGATAAATISGNGGSAMTNPVAAGGSYSSTLTNTGLGSHGTTLTLNGTASAATTSTATFLDAQPGHGDVSDIVNLEGFGNDLKLVQLSYDSALAVSLTGSDTSVVLDVIDPTTGERKNAILYNVGGGTGRFIFGAPPATPELGLYGIDLSNHTAWAFVNHSSEYVVSIVPVPEPTVPFLAAAGVLAWRRFRRNIRM